MRFSVKVARWLAALPSAFRVATLLSALLGSLLLTACAQTGERPEAGKADTIYISGNIITLDPEHPKARAIAIRNGRILGVGAELDMKPFWDPRTRVIGLAGHTLIPGFIETNAHLTQIEMLSKEPNLTPTEERPIRSMVDIVQILQNHIRQHQIPEGTLVIGWNYDESQLYDRRHPTRLDLDLVSSRHPVCVVHYSGDIGACNSLALQRLGIGEFSVDPPSGHIRRDPRGRPIGVLENAALDAVFRLKPVWAQAPKTRELNEAQTLLASQGITTVVDSGTPVESYQAWLGLAQRQELQIDIVAYPPANQYEQLLAKLHKVGDYQNHLKFGGVSLAQDGSLIERNAYLSQPYFKSRHGIQRDDPGAPLMPQYQLTSWVDQVFYQNLPLRIHCQGDACIDMALDAINAAQVKYGRSGHRAQIVDAQVVRPDQLKLMKQMGVEPSFAMQDPYLYSLRYRAVLLGPQRSVRTSPLAEAEAEGLDFSIHTGTPAAPANPLLNLYIAVTRATREGEALGGGESVSAATALKALTLNAAYQTFEENLKGSLQAGKLADMVVLSDDPLAVDPAHIKDIQVLETIKEGRTVYKIKGP